MDDKWYAWSNFPGAKKKVGDSISQADFEDMPDDEWQYLIETGVVRHDPYPNVGSSKSPTEHMKEQIAQAEGSTQAFTPEPTQTQTQPAK